DATLDAFTDSDFHLGGTDARGYFLGGKLGVADSTSVTLRWMSANTISLPQALNIDVLQLDLNTSF
ncbi:putative porin, partial [Acinetobacter baumannii]